VGGGGADGGAWGGWDGDVKGTSVGGGEVCTMGAADPVEAAGGASAGGAVVTAAGWAVGADCGTVVVDGDGAAGLAKATGSAFGGKALAGGTALIGTGAVVTCCVGWRANESWGAD